MHLICNFFFIRKRASPITVPNTYIVEEWPHCYVRINNTGQYLDCFKIASQDISNFGTQTLSKIGNKIVECCSEEKTKYLNGNNPNISENLAKCLQFIRAKGGLNDYMPHGKIKGTCLQLKPKFNFFVSFVVTMSFCASKSNKPLVY